MELVLLQASTGSPHPNAQVPRIVVKNTFVPAGIPPSLAVAGDNIAIIATLGNLRDRLRIYDWKTGNLKKVNFIPNCYLLTYVPH